MKLFFFFLVNPIWIPNQKANVACFARSLSCHILSFKESSSEICAGNEQDGAAGKNAS